MYNVAILNELSIILPKQMYFQNIRTFLTIIIWCLTSIFANISTMGFKIIEEKRFLLHEHSKFTIQIIIVQLFDISFNNYASYWILKQEEIYTLWWNISFEIIMMFPGILCTQTMNMFVTLFVFFSFLQFINNQICTG